MTSIGIPIEKGYPQFVAVNLRTGTVYLSYNSSNFILPINTTLRTKEPKIECKSLGNIAINHVTSMIYASSTDGICMIDGSTNRFKSYIRNGTGRSRGDIEINAATNTIYATCFDSNVLTVIDGISGSLTAKIEVGKDHRGIAIDPISKKIFVANSGSNSISVVDEQSNKVVDTIKIELDSGAAGKIPKFIIADPSMKQLYVQYCEILRAEGMAIFATSLLVIDTIKKTTVSKRQLYVNLATSPTDGLAFAFNNNNKVLYTSRKASNTVLMLDTYGKKVLKKIVLEKGKIWKNFVSHIISIAEPIARDTKTKSIRDRQQQESII